MRKKLMISIFVLLGLISGGKLVYEIANPKTYYYGIIPNDAAPLEHGRVEYTVPTVDEHGNTRTETFSAIKKLKEGAIFKLTIRNNIVKSYDIIAEEQLPSSIKNNLKK